MPARPRVLGHTDHRHLRPRPRPPQRGTRARRCTDAQVGQRSSAQSQLVECNVEHSDVAPDPVAASAEACVQRTTAHVLSGSHSTQPTDREPIGRRVFGEPSSASTRRQRCVLLDEQFTQFDVAGGFSKDRLATVSGHGGHGWGCSPKASRSWHLPRMLKV